MKNFGDVNTPVQAWSTFNYNLQRIRHGKAISTGMEKSSETSLHFHRWRGERKDRMGKNASKAGSWASTISAVSTAAHPWPPASHLERRDGHGLDGAGLPAHDGDRRCAGRGEDGYLRHVTEIRRSIYVDRRALMHGGDEVGCGTRRMDSSTTSSDARRPAHNVRSMVALLHSVRSRPSTASS